MGVLMCVGLLLASCAALRPSADPRDQAVRAYQYPGLRDELIVEPLKLSTSVAKPGDRVTREAKVTLLSPNKEKKFKVTEVTTLTGSGLSITLSREESEKTQGSHVSTIHFLVPRDMPQGVYTLVTTVATDEEQITRKANFQVAK